MRMQQIQIVLLSLLLALLPGINVGSAAPRATITVTTATDTDAPPPSQAAQTIEAEPPIYFTTTDQRILRVDGQGQNETQLLGPLPLQRMAYDASTQKVYGATREGAIRRMNPDGTGLETLLTGLDNPIELRVDSANGKMYWLNQGGAAIQRANLDGSDLETVVPSGEVSDGEHLILDPARDKLYWLRDDDEIRRANLDGSDVETLVSAESFNELACLVLDEENQTLYWVNDGGSGSSFIGRSNLDGTNPEEIVALPDFPDVSCPIIDPTAAHIFWGDADDDAIKRANLDGSDVQTIITGLDTPRQLALGPDDKLYWAEREDGPLSIRRADADGSNVETLVTDLSQVFQAGPLFLILDDVQKLLWNDWDVQLATADLDDSNVTVLYDAPGATNGIALDEQNQHLYWADRGAVQRATVDGAGVETVIANANAPTVVAVDSAGGKLYWTDGGLDTVNRANLDGSDAEVLYTHDDSPTLMRGLAVDATNGKLYWSTSHFSGGVYQGTLWRSNLDGSDPEVFVEGLGAVGGVAINGAGTVAYWIDNAGQKVQRLDVADKSVTDLITGPNAAGSDLLLDEGRGHLYWADVRSGTIHRANTDGSDVTTIYSGPATPAYLTISSSAGPAQDVSLYLPAVLRE